MKSHTANRIQKGLHPPSRWVCPQCATKVVTHIPTYVPECRSAKHRGNLVYMDMVT